MTKKQSILKRYPDAYCYISTLHGAFVVYLERNCVQIGKGSTEQRGWADAYAAIERMAAMPVSKLGPLAMCFPTDDKGKRIIIRSKQEAA